MEVFESLIYDNKSHNNLINHFIKQYNGTEFFSIKIRDYNFYDRTLCFNYNNPFALLAHFSTNNIKSTELFDIETGIVYSGL